MGHRKYVGRVLAGILAVGMFMSSMPSAVYAAEYDDSVAVVTGQETVVLEEEPVAETGVVSAETEPAGKEETESGQESAGSGTSGNEEEEAGKENVGQPEGEMEETEEDQGEQSETMTDSGQTEENGEPVNSGTEETEAVEETANPDQGEDLRTDVENRASVFDVYSGSAEERLAAMAAEGDIASGVVDDSFGNIAWVIDKNGKLTVEGTGDYGYGPPPWRKWAESIVTAKISVENMTSAACLFEKCKNLVSVDLSRLDTSKIRSMVNMFAECSKLKSLDVSGFDTCNVESMGYMFWHCSSLTSLDVSHFDTGKVEAMDSMFDGCENLASLDVSHFDTGEVVYMGYMFSGCSSLISLDVSGFDTGKVEHMDCMFYDCNNLTSLDVSHFDTSEVVYMEYMFSGCSNLISLDVSGFDTRKVEHMNDMFSGCHKLTSLDVSHFDTSKVTCMVYMFNGCSSLTSLDVSHFDTSNVAHDIGDIHSSRDSMRSMFSGCSSLTSLDVSHFDTSKVADMSSMFSGCSSLTSLDLSHFDTSNVVGYYEFGNIYGGMQCMFSGCSSLTSLNLSGFNTSNVKKMDRMFSGCSNLTSLNLSSFRTRNVVDMGGMFENCSNLASLDLNCFDTGNVTSMAEMFSGCSSLTSLNINGFNTSNVETMRWMFSSCSSLISLNLVGFDVSKISNDEEDKYGWIKTTGLDGIFENCVSLNSIQLPNNLTCLPSEMFMGCSKLTNVNIPGRVTSIGSRAFEGCTELSHITLPNSLVSIRNRAFARCNSLTGIAIPNSVTDISGAFSGCTALANIAIPDSVTDISGAFSGCTALANIAVPNSVTDMDEAFSGCTALRNIDLSDGLTHIGYETFSNCTSLTGITIPSGVGSIAYGAFRGCTALESIDLPDSLAHIESYAFSECKKLTDVYYEGSKNEWQLIIVDYENNELAKAAVHYARGDFENADMVWGLNKEGVLTINGKGIMPGYDAVNPVPWHEDCARIKSVILSGSITHIGASAFTDCKNLTSISIPVSVLSIGNSALYGCINLSDIYYAGDSKQWLAVNKGHYNNDGFANATIHYSKVIDLKPAVEYTDTRIHYESIPFQTWYSEEKSIGVEWGWDKIIKNSTKMYDGNLAKISLALSSATEHSQEKVESLLEELGFDDWDTKDGSPRPTFAHKLITRKDGSKVHVVAVVLRGTSGFGDVAFDVLSSLRIMNWNASSRKDDLRHFIQAYNEKSDEPITEDNVKFWVTGHSLGAATANILAEDLSKEYGRDNVVAYTFAAPGPCSFTTPTNDENNINNIICAEDNVPSHFSTRIGWNGYGRKGEFRVDVNNTRDSINDQYNKLTGKYIRQIWDAHPWMRLHATEVYLSFLETGYDPYRYSGHYYLIEGHCPVDLKVYDSDGTIVGSTTNNEIDMEYVVPGVQVIVDQENDNAKYVRIFEKGDYIVEWTGTDDGTMEYSVKTVDANTDEMISEKTFVNVSLYKGKKLTSEINTVNNSDVRLHVVNDDGNIVKEVQENGAEIPFSGYSVKLDANGGSVNPAVIACNSDGKIERLPIPYLAGYIFTGWYTDKVCTVPWNSDIDRVKEDMTLYAGWKSDGNSGQMGDVLPEDIPTDGKIPEGLWTAAIADVTYTGTAVKPDAHVYDGNVRLREGTDYTVSYKNNIKAAKSADAKAPTVTVTGKGNYFGKETAAFTILPVEIGSSEVFAADFQVKIGRKAVKPVPELYYLGTKLSDKQDFTITYANTSGVYDQTGEYDVTVTGKGNYTGMRTLKLKAVETLVKPKSVSLAKASLAGFEKNFVYTGQACRQQCTLTVTMPDGSNRTLTEGTDYTVLYADNKKAGKATVTYCGRNGYTGKLKKTYKIQQYNIQENAEGKIRYETLQSCVYMKGGCKPKPDILFNGERMKEGADYTLSYQNNKVAGGSKTPTVTVTGKNSFTGKIQIPFTIVPQDLSNMILVSGDRVYKNKANIYRITPKLMDLDGKLLTAGNDFDKNSITYAYETDVALENGVNKKAGDAVEKTDIIPADTWISITLAKGSGGEYTGTYTGSYRIARADIGSARVTIPDQIYTGQEIRPDQSQITVKLAGKVLTSEDYKIVRYNNNVDKGKASVVLEGKGNYGGMKTVTFTIRAKGFLWWWKSVASTAY